MGSNRDIVTPRTIVGRINLYLNWHNHLTFRRFATVVILLGTCAYIIVSAIMDSFNKRWVASGTCQAGDKIWPNLNKRCNAAQTLKKCVVKIDRTAYWSLHNEHSQKMPGSCAWVAVVTLWFIEKLYSVTFFPFDFLFRQFCKNTLKVCVKIFLNIFPAVYCTYNWFLNAPIDF